MKKSQYINIALVVAVLSTSACSNKEDKAAKNSHLYLRSDTNAHYTHVYHPYRYHGFSPVGLYFLSTLGRPVYRSTGYESYSTPHSSTARSQTISRGGFGRSAFSVGSGRS